ncbi:MAG TPA: hypothetical protein VNE38_12950 [Ktedonobacteraceae bacterium]|nr:hypothetical protein [Ktedonobacteraceae bacterium]
MSIRDRVTTTTRASETAIHEGAAREQRHGVSHWYLRWQSRREGSYSSPKISPWPLLLCLFIALVVRSWLAYHTAGFIDGDEALVGMQAQHILQGQLPTYFYNQPYMGSLEAYVMAAIFAVAGSSVWTLRTEPILLSLVVVWLTWQLAGVLADTAGLPLHAKQWFMNIAALLAAIPPLYDTVLEMRMLGGYIEIFILMQLLLLSALQLTNRRAAGAPARELALRWAAIGFLVGFGFWVNPIIIYGVLALALWIAWDCLKVLRQSRSLQQLQRGIILPALASLPACIVGMTPALVWGARNQWQNFTYLLQLGANTPLRPEVLAQYPTRASQVIGLARLFTSCVGPRVIGGSLPQQSPGLNILAFPMLLLGVSCMLVTAALVALSFMLPYILETEVLARLQPFVFTFRRLVALPLVFASSTLIIFCVTRTAAIGLWNCQYDLAGRYATPLMLVMPFFVAAICAALVLLEAELYQHTRKDSSAGENAPTLLQPASHTPVPGLLAQKAMLGVMVGFLMLTVISQAGLYGATDPGSTFQSPYCTFAPANNDAIISYMERENIHYAWAINWLAYPIVFKTHSNIIMSDPLPLIRHVPILDRIPAYTNAVLHADRPSLVVLVKHNDSSPLLLQMLDKQQVTYRLARFPAEQGYDVLVVTPLNQTVNPTASAAYFNVFVCSLDS